MVIFFYFYIFFSSFFQWQIVINLNAKICGTMKCYTIKYLCIKMKEKEREKIVCSIWRYQAKKAHQESIVNWMTVYFIFVYFIIHQCNVLPRCSLMHCIMAFVYHWKSISQPKKEHTHSLEISEKCKKKMEQQ